MKKSIRKIFRVGNSRVISIPTTFCPSECEVILRRTDDVILITPSSNDVEMVVSGNLVKKLQILINKIKEEEVLLKELTLLMKAYKEDPNRVTLKRIEELKKRLDEFRVNPDDESPV